MPTTRRAIDAAAQAHGIPPSILYAFAELESGFNESAEGDLDWPKRGTNYLSRVLASKAFAHNPHRGDPSKWHSYGLFQLLAPYHVQDSEDPRILLNPQINADRAAKFIRRLLDETQWDLWATRMRYVGLTARTPPAILNDARRRLDAAINRWSAV